ncbi:hypothetical protein RHMOL_Rhmol13G0150700 [Rhododendron molle]|uniref:Uncharacterized protein n=1 Tax=Rhododendron molle TaxID=49168 RepID=A0ACC0L6S9_RHOML|nr:hypothetical protein RHMOL_Rhmol13G0150700 [Rhododendron molle]
MSTSLWYDNWHPLGPLIAKFGPRIALDFGLPKDATVSRILQNSNWTFPITQTIELNEIRRTLPPLIPSRLEEADHIRWTLTRNGQFTIASLWDKLRTPFPTVVWHKLVWFSAHIPRSSFITWLAIQNRLSTADRLVMFGMNLSPQCSFCQESESHDHLFFNCSFSQQVWCTMLSKIHVSWHSRSWHEWVTFLSKVKGKAFQAVVTMLVFTTTMYHVWIERNVRKFQASVTFSVSYYQALMVKATVGLLILLAIVSCGAASFAVFKVYPTAALLFNVQFSSESFLLLSSFAVVQQFLSAVWLLSSIYLASATASATSTSKLLIRFDCTKCNLFAICFVSLY